ncbi:hypothetical protein LVJ94_52570 [Pendulispora rubella]|uniref:Uncharacterized protein n=1 Tax=Pendulispora rubella TaxID=2741070 RepID=A0ABZ2L7I8_9BACT
MSDFEPLPPDLAALFEREKQSYDDDAGLKARVLSHVEWAVALGGPPGGGGGGGDPSGGAGHGGGDAPATGDGGASLASGGAHAAGAMHAAGAAFGLKTVVAATVSAFVAGGAVGGTVVKTVAPSLEPHVAVSAPAPSDFRGAPRPTFIAPPPIATLEQPEEPADLPPLDPEPAPKASSNAHLEHPGDITREREVLDAARAALARGRPEDAIAAAERHAQKWPRGYLVEEREAVLIQALALGGRRDEAERRANTFRKAYPQSILLPAIDAALTSP